MLETIEVQFVVQFEQTEDNIISNISTNSVIAVIVFIAYIEENASGIRWTNKENGN